VIRRSLRDAAQLTNMYEFRISTSYVYLTLVAALTVGANYLGRQETISRPDSVVEVVFVAIAMILLSCVDVRIERGRLSLAGIAFGTGSLVLNPLDATIVGLLMGIPMARRGPWSLLGNGVMAASYGCLGALVAAHFRTAGTLTVGSRVLVLIVVNVASWILISVGLSIRSGESIPSIVTHNFTAQFYAAFAYFALAAFLISYVLDGSLLGYFLATIVFALSLALTDTIAGRRVRRGLESELADADRHLFHSRAVEGVVHNLRNHIATTVGYLKEIDLHRLDPVDRNAVETASAAANDAVTVLRDLSQGATPRVSFAPEPIDLNELGMRALDLARPRARVKEVELALRETPEEAKVKADPLLLREVITNLINNAIDAAPRKGRVELSTGRRANGQLYVSVGDNGPGVSDENRHHLFEPHFTTKETGTGLGLFMSYGIVREHQGQLLFEGTRRGAVFTVVLPPYSD
jgi:signal transduction histidine kinase